MAAEEGERIADEFELIVEKMCACKDKVCSDKVNTEFEAWVAKNKDAKGAGPGLRKRTNELSERFVKCQMSAEAK